MNHPVFWHPSRRFDDLNVDQLAGRIANFLDAPFEDIDGYFPVVCCRTCGPHIRSNVFPLVEPSRPAYQRINIALRRVPGWVQVGRIMRMPDFGQQRYYVREGITPGSWAFRDGVMTLGDAELRSYLDEFNALGLPEDDFANLDDV